MTFSYKEMGAGFFVELEYSAQKIDSDVKTPLKTLKTPLKTPLKGVKKEIVEILTEQPDVTQAYIANKTKRNIFTIKKHYKWLIDNGFIQRIGPDKGGRWEVLNKS